MKHSDIKRRGFNFYIYREGIRIIKRRLFEVDLVSSYNLKINYFYGFFSSKPNNKYLPDNNVIAPTRTQNNVVYLLQLRQQDAESCNKLIQGYTTIRIGVKLWKHVIVNGNNNIMTIQKTKIIYVHWYAWKIRRRP